MTVAFRPAVEADLAAVVGLLADDPLGGARERPDDLDRYRPALQRIRDDPYQHLVVAVLDGVVVGTAQLGVVTTLSRQGATRGIVEAVRVAADRRGTGLGAALLEHLIGLARREGCSLVQLTSDRSRVDAHRFYERLGFEASHLGFKLSL